MGNCKSMCMRPVIDPNDSSGLNGEHQIVENSDMVVDNYEDGSRFEGQKVDEMKDGQGTFYNKDGVMEYKGAWRKNERQGSGTEYNCVQGDYTEPWNGEDISAIGLNWVKWEGGFSGNKRNGRGTLLLSSCEKFVGTWIDGVFDGEGEIHRTTGKVAKGTWSNGKLQRLEEDGQYTEYFKDIDGIPFKYVGQKAGGMKQGQGTLFSDDGLIAYCGTWHQDKYEGEGREYNPCPGALRKKLNYLNFELYGANWVRYQGSYCQGKKHGPGELILTNGEKFQGNWDMGKVHGKGKIFKTCGEIILGEWNQNRRVEDAQNEGFGDMKPSYDLENPKVQNLIKAGQALIAQSFKEKNTKMKLKALMLEDGAIYLGEWKGGQKCGYGEQRWPDNSIYTGEWIDNKANGKGKLIHADGDQYEGDWVNDKANGQGTYTHANQAKYTGEWLNDMQHGQGEEHWPDGAKYVGNYFEGKKHGRGQLFFGDGSNYKGEFNMNDIEGNGKYVWPDNKIYDGGWKGNQMCGQGKYWWSDGRFFEGEYLNDKKHGFGKFVWSDGRVYEGQWENGKQHGEGHYTNKEGLKRKGIWERAKRIKWLDEGVQTKPATPQ